MKMEFREPGIMVLTAITLIQLSQRCLGDKFGCIGGHRSITVPQITDNSGRFLTHSFQEINNTSTKLFISMRWQREKLRLVLERHDIVAATSTAEWSDSDNVTNAEQLNSEGEQFYQGHVQGRQFSFAAISVNGGLTGYIFLDGVGIFIEPIIRHSIVSSKFSPHIVHSCTRHKPYTQDKDTGSVPPKSNSIHVETSRKRRALPGSYTRYLEVLIVADTTVVNFVGKDKVKSYILGLMNIVNAVYHDSSLGVAIEVVTVKIMYMDSASEKRVISLSDPKRTVDQFCQWASTKTYRMSYYDKGVNHDVAVLLTRNKFAPAGKISIKLLITISLTSSLEFNIYINIKLTVHSGYAPITGLCVPMRNCALVKDDGFTSAFVIAHEVGHVFGLFHDGQGNTCHGREYTTSIMATMVQSSFHHYWWSGCSKTRMAEVIPHLNCLNNNPFETVENTIRLPVGMSWSLDEQCRLEFGEKSSHCRIFPSLDACAQLWCGEGPGTYTCKTKNVVPLDGTTCGPSIQWYCMDGSCGYHGNNAPVNGGWSGWSSWSQCSSGCGTGFKRRSRHCDDPKPQFGGNACDGSSENSDTCKSQECLEYVDMRATQCSVMDIVQVRQGTHSWKPYQTEKEADICKLTCVSLTSGEVVTFDTLVDNGTPCTYDEPNNICLDGTCIKVGCNGVRDSSVKEDKCGVCGGDGKSCKVVEGVYKKQFKYSAADGYYETVLVLPEGSRDIDISETFQSPHFLAIQDTVYYQYVLNGQGRQYPSRNFVIDGAWFRYTNNGGHEKLTSRGPLHSKVNVMIYPMDWQKTASVAFRYTVDKNDFTYESNKFRWKYEAWSPCSVSCGKGVQRIIYGCYDKETDEKVEEESCQFLEAPDREDVACERISCKDLKYRWRMSREWSTCSASCGKGGLRHQLFDCESVETEETMDKQFCVNIPEPIKLESCNIKPCTTAKYNWVVTSEWSPCSASCGVTGSQYQLYYCAQEQDGGKKMRVEDKFCSDLTDPKEPRPCNRLPCVTYSWIDTGKWNDCSEECGVNGTQFKKLECQRRIGEDSITIVGVRHCSDVDQPMETRECNRRACFTYKWEELNEWTNCSQECGDGTKSKLTICKNVTYDNREVRTEEKHCKASEIPIVVEECNNGPCVTFDWVLTDNWTECSAACGIGGKQTRISVCQQTKGETVTVVNDSFCSKDKDTQTISCNRKPCHTFDWQVSDWSACPDTCNFEHNINYRTRKVTCSQVFINGMFELTEDRFCDKTEMPHIEELCNVSRCQSYRLDVSTAWSDCSATCGDNGTQTQLVDCIEDYGNGTILSVDLSYCDNDTLSKEQVSRICVLPPCVSFRLNGSDISDWGECSVSCGKGVQQQLLQCVRLSGDGLEEEVDLSFCTNVNLTVPIRECDMGPCGFLEWGAGDWSGCSKTCGPGKQKRIIYCGDPLHQSDRSRCLGKAPAEYRNCNMGNCGGPQGQCKNRAPFCHNSTARTCRHPPYRRVCCASCQRYKQQQRDQPRRYFYRGR